MSDPFAPPADERRAAPATLTPLPTRWVVGTSIAEIVAAIPMLGLSLLFDPDDNSLANGVLALVLLAALGVWFVIRVVGGIFWLTWMSRAYRNLSLFEPRMLNYSPTSAVLWWFAPVANLWMPYRVIDEIWRESGHDGSPTPWLGLYWAAHVVSLILDRAAQRIDAPWLAVIAILGDVATCVFAILLVRAIAERQIDTAAARRR